MTARNYGLSSIFISTRPASLPNFILSNANHCFCYGLNNRGDVDWIKDYIGENAELLFPVIKRKKVQNEFLFPDTILEKHDCLYYNQLSQKEAQIIRGF